MRRFVSTMVLMVVSLFPAAAAAQDEGAVGVMMAVPGSIGLVWQTSDRLAFRPEMSFGWGTSETDVAETTSTQFTVGVSALVNTGRWESLSTYFAPRYAFSRTSAERKASGLTDDSSSRVHRFSGSYGAQYRLGRFEVFGELGLQYDHASAGSEPDESKGRSFATRSQLGVVLYF